MVIMTWCISESISDSDVNNDGNLGDKILIYFDHSWTAWGALTFLLYEEYIPQTPIVFVRSGLSQTKSFWEDGEFYMSSDELITACSILVLCWNILSILHTASHGLNPAFRLDQYFLYLFLSLSTQQQPLPFTFSNMLVVGRIWWFVLGCHRYRKKHAAVFAACASCFLLAGMKK